MTPQRRAFTLIELLVSTTLILVVITAATTATAQMLTTSRRLQALQTLDSSAATAQIHLNGQATAMHPCAAVWLRSNQSEQSVELVFMHAKFSPQDYPGIAQPSKNMQVTDLLWTRWYWTAASGIFQVSSSRSSRWFRIDAGNTRNYWKIPGGSTMPSGYGTTFLSVPQPQSATGTATAPNNPVDLLNANAWQSGERGDVGDYDDLLLTAQPLLWHCSDVSLSLQTLAGAVQTADGTADLSWAAPGSAVDGRHQSGLTDRPGIIRLRFTLSDPKTKATSTYSFSFSTPTFSPY